LLVRSNKSKKLLHLSSIAQVSRGYREVPKDLAFYNGKPALLLGVSILSGGNVVKIGKDVGKRLRELVTIIPVGIEGHMVYNQPAIVQGSVKGFMISLIEALLIVVAVLLVAMGMRSGFIIAAILLLTVLGTLFLMHIFGITLQRISLGALIIALGMLVDNAIVVTEGILVKVQQGIEKLKASKDVVAQVIWPLFGSTVVGILAFAPIGLSQDSTGEYTISLFYVILISLLISWLLAITAVPLFAHLFFKPPAAGEQITDPYKSFFYMAYKKILITCLNRRKRQYAYHGRAKQRPNHFCNNILAGF